MDIICNPRHPGTSNIINIELFVFSTGYCGITLTYTNGSKIACMRSPKEANCLNVPINYINMQLT